jgi:hypothetical protein
MARFPGLVRQQLTEERRRLTSSGFAEHPTKYAPTAPFILTVDIVGWLVDIELCASRKKAGRPARFAAAN